MTRSHSMASLAMLAMLGLALVGYWPGLSGVFLLDDYGTLPRLVRYGSIDSLDRALLFLAGDITGTGGRPISLLSFALNSQTWPADPWAFKLTNVVLHLLTGWLLYLVLRQLLRLVAPYPAQAAWAAALATGFWLLNPFNVSTVLYVVQRMAMLSAFFMLAGMAVYLHGRALLASRPRAAHYWMSVAILVFTPLAVFSKENGALLPLLILVLECTLLSAPAAGQTATVPSTRWSLFFLWLPSLAVLAALVHFAAPQAYEGRTFDLAERLLTEARVLIDYLWHWFNPLATPRGILADDYPVSRGLLAPWTTLPAVAGVIVLLAWAAWRRRRHPLAAATILFYVAGHLMESTVLPLEVYFEHRNYLPAMLLALPMAAWAAGRTSRPGTAAVVATLILLALSAQTYRLAGIWGNDLALAKWSTLVSPGSVRAIDHLANTLSRHGRPDLAIGVLEEGLRQHPEFSHFQLHLLGEKCLAGQLGDADWERVYRHFGRHPIKDRSFPLLASLLTMTDSAECTGMDGGHMLRLVVQLADHPATRSDARLQRLLLHLKGDLLARQGDAIGALAAFGASVELRPSIGVGLQQVALLASHGYFREGLVLLDRVETLPEPAGLRDRTVHRFYAKSIPALRQTLLDDLARPQAGRP